MRLTQKQEMFTQNLFKGMTQREAWIQAGYSSKYAFAIIDTNACNLANSNKIKTRYAELNEKAEDLAIAPVRERKQRLSTLLRAPIPKGVVTPTHMLQATDLLNKMDKIYSEGATVNIDNRKVEIIVSSDTAKQLTEKIIKGENT